MHHLDLITSLAACLIAALVGGYVTQRLGLSPIVGYLLAGIAVGPSTPGYVANQQMADEFAEIGVILLMFGVGLQFHWRELLAVRRVAIPGAIGQSLVATLLGLLVAVSFDWSLPAGLVYGLAISVASTVVLMRVLADHHALHTPAGHIAVGWLVVEDLLTVLILVLLPLLVGAGNSASSPWASIGLAVLKLLLLVALVIPVGSWLIPWLLGLVARTRSRELFTLTVLVVVLGIAVGSARIFGASMPLGAFLAGMVVGRSDFSARAASEAMPMRDAFAVLFFVSIGMLFEPAFLWESPGLVAATLFIVLAGKPVAAYLIVKLLRYPTRTALTVAIALAQIGEFSFILANLGEDLGVLPEKGNNVLILAALISITLNPLYFRGIGWLEKRLDRPRPAGKKPAPAIQPEGEEEPPLPPKHRVVLVGYGPVGRTLVRILRGSHLEPVLIEMNLQSYQQIRREGLEAVHGDASLPEVLEKAGLSEAISLILTSADTHNAGEIVRQARELNPSVKVLARVNYVREIGALRHLGADAVFAGEGEVALTMTEFLLRKLGATADQIDREGDRVRSELLVGSVPPELTLLNSRRDPPPPSAASEGPPP